MRDAGASHVPPLSVFKGVQGRGQTETIVGGAVTLAVALWQQFSVHGDMLDWVEVFKYLGCLLLQDDNNIQAICNQLQKARTTWACGGQVFRGKHASPHIATKFYKAIVQARLLYGSKTWVLFKTALVRLERFHIHAA
jgi:hypothetical protein